MNRREYGAPSAPPGPVRGPDRVAGECGIRRAGLPGRTRVRHRGRRGVGRAGGGESRDASRDPSQFLTLADRIGLETLAELWRGSAPGSLPGSLWALYLLRTWCRDNADEVARLWRAGRPYAPADEVVAGVADDADPAAMVALADAVLAGAYRGDFAVALERAAAFFRVVATGRRESGRRSAPTVTRAAAGPIATTGPRTGWPRPRCAGARASSPDRAIRRTGRRVC